MPCMPEGVGRCHAPPTPQVVQGSWCEPLEHLRGRLGGLVSNPPYIPRREMEALQVRRLRSAGCSQ
jgi:methylase of polypeptide subunit release factors